jgi:hypothetical protein
VGGSAWVVVWVGGSVLGGSGGSVVVVVWDGPGCG